MRADPPIPGEWPGLGSRKGRASFLSRKAGPIQSEPVAQSGRRCSVSPHDGGTPIPIQQRVAILRDGGGSAVSTRPLRKRGAGADAPSFVAGVARICRAYQAFARVTSRRRGEIARQLKGQGMADNKLKE